MEARLICLFSISALLLSSVSSQLEFSLNPMPIKDQFNFPLQNFALVSDPEDKDNFTIEGTTLLEMTRMVDGLYTIKLTLGTPPQEFEVIVDTGSYMLWVPSSKCYNCYNIKNKLNVDQSVSLIKNNKRLNINYVSGRISGEVCYEQVNAGSSVSLPQFKFLLTDSIDVPISNDGILGLTKVYRNYDPSYSFIDSLYREGKIGRRIFSQKIEDKESKLTVGNLPKEIEEDIGNFTKCQTIRDEKIAKSYWACNLKQVLIIKESVHEDAKSKFFYSAPKKVINLMNKPRPAIFDTGSNVIMAPEEYFDFFRYVFFKDMIDVGLCKCLNDRIGSKGFECGILADLKALPKMRFVFDNDLTYEINIHDFFVKSRTTNRYLFRIVFGDLPGNMWLLGQPFLKQYHVVFDHDEETVGLYPGKKEGKVVNTIMSLYEFETAAKVNPINNNVEDADLDLENILVYLAIFYISALILSLLIALALQLFKKIFGKEKLSEVDQDIRISLVTTEVDNISNTL